MPEAFYLPDGERFTSTELTRGPWDPGHQHAGPPAALLARELERCERRDEARIARMTCEILRAVPIAPLSATARVVRGGRSVELLEGELRDERGPVLRARAWRLRTQALDLPAPADAPAPLPGPDQGADLGFFPAGQEVGYHTAMESRFLRGAFTEPGPATVWMRMRRPLVAGEDPSPLQRVLTAADSGNGVSAALDWQAWTFVNVDLTVVLHRPPAGEWIALDAVTLPQPDGTGLADATLHDEAGPIGRGLQTLLVSPRGESA